MDCSKQTLRRAMRAQRAALGAATVELAGRHLASRLAVFAPYLEALVVLAYLAKDNEVPTDPVVEDAWRRHKGVYVPKVGEDWFSRYEPGTEVVRGEAGVMEFSDGAPLVTGVGRGIVLVPLLAWSRRGDRLGRGGGWYDRVLPRLGMPTVGVGYEFQEQEHVPNEPTDVRLDYVVTESRLVECGRVLSERRLS
jgi:5-formyltetrahydrofolate cyclo-ligase